MREDVIEWMSQLKEAGVYDWMLVAVEPADARRANKAKLLSRATVFDRMRADFPSKHFDRYVVTTITAFCIVCTGARIARVAFLSSSQQLPLNVEGVCRCRDFY